MPSVDLVVAAHTGATLFMTGVIWFVQVVHYPLFAAVPGAFADYEARHTRRTTWVVGPVMLVEGVTAAALVARPGSPAVAWVGLALLGVVWISTYWLQIPCHRQLRHRFAPAVHRRLVRSNWIRTAAWSLRGLVALWMARAA